MVNPVLLIAVPFVSDLDYCLFEPQRMPMPEVQPDERKLSLVEQVIGYNKDEAQREEHKKKLVDEMQWGLDMQSRESTQKFIDPRDSRPFLIRALKWLRNRKQEWAPKKHENIRV